MDANGLRSFSLSFDRGLYKQRAALYEDPEKLETTVEPCATHLVTAARLSSRAPDLDLREKATRLDEVARPSTIAIDIAGNYVVADPTGGELYSVSHLRATQPQIAPLAVTVPDPALPVRDLAFGADAVLYVAGGAGAPGILLLDMRARFDPALVGTQVAFRADRIAAEPRGGLLALDVARKRLGRVRGLPLFTRGVDAFRDRNERFEAVEPNPQPLEFELLAASFPDEETPLGIAAADDGSIAVLCLVADRAARVRLVDAAGQLSAAVELRGPRFPHAVGWLDDTHLALATDGHAVPLAGNAPAQDPGAFVYELPPQLKQALLAHESSGSETLWPLGDYYPLVRQAPAPFAVVPRESAAARSGPRLYYSRAAGSGLVEPAPLARLSLSTRASYGAVANFPDGRIAGSLARTALGLIDSRDPATVWHRLYVEAQVPTGCALIVWLCANDGGPPKFEADLVRRGPREAWFPHLIGDPAALPRQVAAALPKDLPRAAWVRDASEVPLGASHLGCERRPQISGLFTALVQRADRAVRSLRGRRLWAVVELFGNGQLSPELAVLRCYAGRFSYRDRYLPALYREQVAGAGADRLGGATGADFLERFIDLFEGLFTSIEDRIAAAHLFTDLRACPPQHLAWLAGWIGLALEPGTPAQRAREMIAKAPRLARRHGTLEGLRLALDLVTDGAVQRGRLLVVENFRLRRTLATILGARLADFDDPLTAGIARSGNSLVGDSLFLGDEHVKTFLALFRSLEPRAGARRYEAIRLEREREAAVHALYDGLAYRVTVLVHEAEADDLRLAARVASVAAPAHVQVQVVAAQYPFLVAVASLVGVDTFVGEPQPTAPVRIGQSRLGYVDTLQGLATLDPHGGAFQAALQRPVADAGSDREVSSAENFTLDASGSRAARGRRLTSYRWTWLPPEPPPGPG
jgi:phage tail-like protein